MLMHSCTVGLTHAPFVLLPSPIPRACFAEAFAIAPLFNLLIDRVSRDAPYLSRVLAPAAAADPFTRRQLDLLTASSSAATFRLGLHRHDYMIHDPPGASSPPRLQQVEMNTISAAFSSLGTTVSTLHRFLSGVSPPLAPHFSLHHTPTNQELPPQQSSTNQPADPRSPGERGCEAAGLPVNQSDVGHARMLALAHAHYDGPAGAVVLIVVLPGENNLFDQRKLEHLLWERHGVRCVRQSLGQVRAGGRLDEGRRLLLAVDGRQEEVAVAYFRAGYMPEHYAGEEEWEARRLIEDSRAVKCPTVGYQLAGSKKVQQDLAAPGVLERFFPEDADGSVARRLRGAFAELFPLDDSEASREAQARAVAHPEDFVLKPQREGGGNNLYRAQLRERLTTASPAELSAFILMSRIVPRAYPMLFVRNRHVEVAPGISELGTFAGLLASDDQVVANEATGFLLRSKSTVFDDGGVAAGVAFLDSPLLFDD